ncbi:peroxiredoxin [Magnetospira sp. QH-2]|uniref:peroxiredoxin n=1 Tax=Magnetospira sp. (strain QH-2) TaxID=1288970 RepID=UPI0003E81691|nr:peroxiredoxin [Magnetospira sp. QH-2]CCQ72386.1 peroxiredoxin [Magnetospira sp. QH-2]
MGNVLVGHAAPDFTAPAVMGDNSINEAFNLKEYLNGSYGVVFFYPLDFTFVCPSEILAFDHRVAAFEERNTKVIGVSVDSHFTHLAWKNTPTNEGGLGQVKFPMVADLTKSICEDYGVVVEGAGIAYRGSFLIDTDGNVRHQVINDLPLGRNVDEMIRMVDALQFHEEHGEVCPAGWNKGDSGMTATPDGVAKYLSDHAEEL